MKLAISYIVMLVPIFAVLFVVGDQFNKQKLKYLGVALALSGLCTAVGVKFFGLYAIGRHSVIEGDKAVLCALVLICFGLALIGIHATIGFFRMKRRGRYSNEG